MIQVSLPDGTLLALSTHGLKPPVDPRAIVESLRGASRGGEVQAFDAERIAGTDHLRQAAVHALRAHRSGAMLTRGLAMELLVYASAQRQIDRAIQLVGVREGTRLMTVALLTEDVASAQALAESLEAEFGQAEDLALNDLGPERMRKIKEAFGIGEDEVKAIRGDPSRAVAELVLERIALLPTRR